MAIAIYGVTLKILSDASYQNCLREVEVEIVKHILPNCTGFARSFEDCNISTDIPSTNQKTAETDISRLNKFLTSSKPMCKALMIQFLRALGTIMDRRSKLFKLDPSWDRPLYLT